MWSRISTKTDSKSSDYTVQPSNILLQLVFRDTLALFTIQMKQTMPGTCVKHEVVRLVQHKTKLLQVVSHQRRSRRLLCQHDQAVYVFHCFVRFLLTITINWVTIMNCVFTSLIHLLFGKHIQTSSCVSVWQCRADITGMQHYHAHGQQWAPGCSLLKLNASKCRVVHTSAT